MDRSQTAFTVVGILAAGFVWAPAASLAQPAEAEPWVLPRTSEGRPDLHGVWANNTATPLERPASLGDQAVLTNEELARVKAQYAQLFAGGESDAAFADSVFTAALGDQKTFSSRDATTGNYNQFWLVDREFDHRTSLVVDPPTGRLPPLTLAADWLSKARAAHLAANPASSWTDRRLQERCVTFGMPNLFAGYNTYYQILQTPDHVVFVHEMIHDARIIPLGDAPHVDDAIRQWHGDARGYWDGDTLVVETTNFSAQAESPAALYQRTRGSAEKLRLIERFTRVGPDTLEHELTVEDPGTYSASWTAMIPLKRSDDPIFEYACHEGNLGMEGILAGHRAEEREAAGPSAARWARHVVTTAADSRPPTPAPMPTNLPIEEILAGSAPPAHLEEIGRSRDGRPIGAWRGGRGPLSVSLVAGCHADEPVGPATLRGLSGWLATLPEHDPAVAELRWSIVPHANPDGEAANAVWATLTLDVLDHQGAADRGFDLAAYSAGVVREPPGDDVEFGFPRSAGDREARPENRAIAGFLAGGAPYAVHGSLHGMAFAPGPWFLIEAGWAHRTTAMRKRLRERVREMDYLLFDPDRGGEKGFTRIDEGFTSRPDSGALRRHFLDRGDPETAALFRPSSMEHVRSLGGDPLTFVSEMPLFLLPTPGAPCDFPDPATGTAGRVAFHRWLAGLLADRSAAEAARAAARHGIRPMPIRDQARLQLEFLDAVLAAARGR